MKPQFIINVGGLDKLGFTEKEFLELFEIDFKKVIPDKNERCPKCKRGEEDTHFIYNKYEDLEFGPGPFYKDKIKNVKWSYILTRYCLCICGCLYVKKWSHAELDFNQKKKNSRGNKGPFQKGTGKLKI